MKGLFTLWLGFVALAAASRSPLQQRTVELVLEDLHSKNYVQWVFKEQAVEDVTEIEDSRGLFVRLRVMLQQTWCRKLPGWSQDCVFKHNGRKRSCLACFKFDNSRPANVLARYVRCMVERQPAAKEMETGDKEECRKVQTQGEEHFPGVYAFSRGLPS